VLGGFNADAAGDVLLGLFIIDDEAEMVLDSAAGMAELSVDGIAERRFEVETRGTTDDAVAIGCIV
jgi:hypothetical protein